MRSVTTALIFLCLGASLISGFVLSPHMWTKIILTHHWPSTFCTMEHCHSDIGYWTIHGLWPDKGIECNSSWHFNSSLIEDLLPDMEKSWPDLLKPSSSAFWKYEWQKHGTCAAKAESLNSQHKYFSKALELYHKVDLEGVLNKNNIVPSEKYYPFPAIEAAIESAYGANPKIQCAHLSKSAGVQVLGQIEICFSPDFTLVDCEKNSTVKRSAGGEQTVTEVETSGFHVCDHSTPVYYPPLH